MSTPLDNWDQGQVVSAQHELIRNLTLELALEVADRLDTPEDIINFALACPGYLNYWIHLTEIMQQRRPHLQDPESNPPFQLPTVQDGLIMYHPRRVELFQEYSEATMQRLFSPEIQRLLLHILFMPSPPEKIYVIDFHRQYPQVGQQDPFPLLFQRRTERFNRYYRDAAYGGLLFRFKNLNRISPYSKAINDFATDFVKKALSADPDRAHHTHPSSANPTLRRFGPLSQQADALRDSSPVRGLSQLHGTERERLMLAFAEYLIQGIFCQFTNQPAWAEDDDFAYSDAVEDAGRQEFARFVYNNHPDGRKIVNLNDEYLKGLRRRGYVF